MTQPLTRGRSALTLAGSVDFSPPPRRTAPRHPGGRKPVPRASSWLPGSSERTGDLTLNRRHFLGALSLFTVPAVLRAASAPAPRHRPVVVAHRGEHTRTHENSLSAIAAAIRAGVDYVELDVRRTRDGEHVLLHDSTLDRTTTGKGKVADLTLAELRQLRLRDRDRPGLPPEPIPTLAEAFEAMHRQIGLYLDFKDGDRATVTRMLRAAGLGEHTVIYDGLGAVSAWRQIAPELPLMISPRPADLEGEGLKELRSRCPVEILDGEADTYTAATVRAVQALGYEVWIDIQDPAEDEAYWRRLLALGTDGLQSDHPAELVAFLKREGRR
jgi:glycerophosphoryl diester phosphodiesterase